MTRTRPVVGILHRWDAPLFTPHFEAARDGFDVIENGDLDRDYDLVVVFEALARAATVRVAGDGLVFVAGEPPEIGRHSRGFLRQFDAVFCAGASSDLPGRVSHEQHFNNWHFGYNALRGAYRLDHHAIVDLPAPAKSGMLSTITSNLNYLPMHIRRRALIERLARDCPGRIDVFGRPHRFVEYKEDAILPYRFHLCVENCAVPGLWTEKIADALLGYSIPVYAGCPDIARYFPDATIPIDLDDYAGTRRTIDALVAEGDAIYRQRFDALLAARRRLIGEYDISSLIAAELRRADPTRGFRTAVLTPKADLPLARARDVTARVRRKLATWRWRRWVANHG